MSMPNLIITQQERMLTLHLNWPAKKNALASRRWRRVAVGCTRRGESDGGNGFHLDVPDDGVE